LTAFILCFTLLFSICASAFSDVDMNSKEGKAIAKMFEKRYIKGYGDDTFRPEATLTRAEFVTIMNKMYMYYMEADVSFIDVEKKDWYYNDIRIGVQAGYIKGMGDGRFAPNEPVTREQVCVMLNSILEISDVFVKPVITDEVSEWARESVEKVLGIYLFTLEPGGKFRATEPITRGEVCVALEKCILDIDFEQKFEPFDLNKIAREELESRLRRIIECMENVIIPTYTDPEVLLVGTMIVDSMKKYLQDPSYDYVQAANDTYEVYRKFVKSEVNMFKEPIYENIEIEDLAILFDFFYTPDMNFAKGKK